MPCPLVTPPISLNPAPHVGTAVAISHHVCEWGGGSCMPSVCQCSIHPVRGYLLFLVPAMPVPVQLTPSIVYVSVFMRVTTAQTHMHICVVNMVPTSAQRPGPAQETGDFPSLWTGHPYPGSHSLTASVSPGNMLPLGACLPPAALGSSCHWVGMGGGAEREGCAGTGVRALTCHPATNLLFYEKVTAPKASA